MKRSAAEDHARAVRRMERAKQVGAASLSSSRTAIAETENDATVVTMRATEKSWRSNASLAQKAALANPPPPGKRPGSRNSGSRTSSRSASPVIIVGAPKSLSSREASPKLISPQLVGKNRTMAELAELRTKKLTKYIHRQFHTMEERSAAMKAAEAAILEQLELRHQQQQTHLGGDTLGVLDKMYMEQNQTAQQLRAREREAKERLERHGYVAKTSMGCKPAKPVTAQQPNVIQSSAKEVFNRGDIRVPEVAKEIEDREADNRERQVCRGEDVCAVKNFTSRKPKQPNTVGGCRARKVVESCTLPMTSTVAPTPIRVTPSSTPVRATVQEYDAKSSAPAGGDLSLKYLQVRTPSPAHSADHAAGFTPSIPSKVFENSDDDDVDADDDDDKEGGEIGPKRDEEKSKMCASGDIGAGGKTIGTAAGSAFVPPAAKGSTVANTLSSLPREIVTGTSTATVRPDTVTSKNKDETDTQICEPSSPVRQRSAISVRTAVASNPVVSANEIAVRKAEEMARKMAEEVDWWCTTSGDSSADDEEEFGASSDVEDGNRWYTYWSDEHQREYYYNPATNSVAWTIPGEEEEEEGEAEEDGVYRDHASARERGGKVTKRTGNGKVAKDYVPVSDFTRKRPTLGVQGVQHFDALLDGDDTSSDEDDDDETIESLHRRKKKKRLSCGNLWVTVPVFLSVLFLYVVCKGFKNAGEHSNESVTSGSGLIGTLISSSSSTQSSRSEPYMPNINAKVTSSGERGKTSRKEQNSVPSFGPVKHRKNTGIPSPPQEKTVSRIKSKVQTSSATSSALNPTMQGRKKSPSATEKPIWQRTKERAAEVVAAASSSVEHTELSKRRKDNKTSAMFDSKQPPKVKDEFMPGSSVVGSDMRCSGSKVADISAVIDSNGTTTTGEGGKQIAGTVNEALGWEGSSSNKNKEKEETDSLNLVGAVNSFKGPKPRRSNVAKENIMAKREHNQIGRIAWNLFHRGFGKPVDDVTIDVTEMQQKRKRQPLLWRQRLLCHIPLAYLFSKRCRQHARDNPIFNPEEPSFMGIQ